MFQNSGGKDGYAGEDGTPGLPEASCTLCYVMSPSLTSP